MECLKFVAVIFSLILITNEISSAKLEDALMNSRNLYKKITKRQALVDNQKFRITEDFQKFVEDKLIQHSQALEFLVKLSIDAVNLISSLVENVGRSAEEPKLPEKVDEYQEVEEKIGDVKESRRSMGPLPLSEAIKNVPERSGTSQWCTVAVLCHRTQSSVCGYDDNFGYGKFKDLCHMLQVNCYWKYNFALVPNCRPNS